MFRIENNVPDVYIQESRDFQLLSRLGDIVLQASRYSINSMQDITSSRYCNSNLLELTKTKLGFFNTREISEDALRSILVAYPYIVKCKGTVRAILLIINLFKQLTQDAINDFSIDYEDHSVNIQLSKAIVYLDIMKDMIQEFLPTGYTLVCTLEGDILLDRDRIDIISGSDRVEVTLSQDDHPEEYNIVTNTRNTSNYGSRVSSSQVVSFKEFAKLRNENNTKEN